MPFRNGKNNLEDLFSSVLSKFKKISPLWKPKINNFGIFQTLKLSNSIGKICQMSLKLNFSRNTLGCYWLRNLIKGAGLTLPSPWGEERWRRDAQGK